MPTLREFMDRQRALFFDPGRPLEGFSLLFGAIDGLFFTPGEVTHGAPHVRDGMSRQRINFIVLAALMPIVLWAMYNAGYSVGLAYETSTPPPDTWQERLFAAGGWQHDHASLVGCLFFGLLAFAPIALVAAAVAAALELLVALARQNAPRGEFLIDALVFSLIVSPATSPWRVAAGMAAGVALTRPFRVWTRRGNSPAVVGWFVLWIIDPWTFDLHTATFAELTAFREYWNASFVTGTTIAMGVAGSLLFLLCGMAMIAAGARSGRSLVACLAVGFVLIAFDLIFRHDSASALWRSMTTGSFAFGAAFFLTYPLASPFSNRARLLSGAAFPVLFLLLRWLTRSSVEATLLSILLLGWIAPALDELIVKSNVRRRQARYARRS